MVVVFDIRVKEGGAMVVGADEIWLKRLKDVVVRDSGARMGGCNGG